MSILEIIKDLFKGPDASFQELLIPDYFTMKRRDCVSTEDYAKWLRQILVQFGAMAVMEKQKGRKVSEDWIVGIVRIEDEIERVRNEGGSSFLPVDNGEKMSDQLKEKK